jgi:ubiquinone biosynthesis protein UbiJ
VTPATLFAATLETALNRYLALDPDAAAAVLDGRVIRIDCTAPVFSLWILGAADRLQVLDSYDGEADVALSGSITELAAVGRGQVQGSGVEIRGDIGVGQQFQSLLRSVQVDWEEGLSRLVGDVGAHQIGNFVRGLGAWGAQAADSLQRQVAEYLQQESEHLPSQDEVNDFLDQVDRLRSDVDRIEARLRRLADRQGPA